MVVPQSALENIFSIESQEQCMKRYIQVMSRKFKSKLKLTWSFCVFIRWFQSYATNIHEQS